MAATERRRYQRVQARTGDYAAYVNGAGSIIDVSLGGVKIRDEEPVDEGTRFNLRMHLGEDLLEGTGVVRRSVPGRGMVVQFTELSDDAKRNLQRYLTQVHLAKRNP